MLLAMKRLCIRKLLYGKYSIKEPLQKEPKITVCTQALSSGFQPHHPPAPFLSDFGEEGGAERSETGVGGVSIRWI